MKTELIKGQLEQIKVEGNISSLMDRAAESIKNSEIMYGDYNLKQVKHNMFIYYLYTERNIKVFFGTLAELKEKLS